jgi:hypothetical protein
VDPIASDHQRAAVLDPEGAVLSMDAEQLPIRPAVPVSLGAEPVAEVERRLPHLRPLRRRDVAAGRGVRGDVLNRPVPHRDRVRDQGGSETG